MLHSWPTVTRSLLISSDLSSAKPRPVWVRFRVREFSVAARTSSVAVSRARNRDIEPCRRLTDTEFAKTVDKQSTAGEGDVYESRRHGGRCGSVSLTVAREPTSSATQQYETDNQNPTEW